MIKPDYNNLGLSYPMGEKLTRKVEKQLSDDIRHYGINNEILKYDWSESVIEGRCAKVLDGHIDNFSDIRVFNSRDEIIAEGWLILFMKRNTIYLFVIGINLTCIRMKYQEK